MSIDECIEQIFHSKGEGVLRRIFTVILLISLFTCSSAFAIEGDIISHYWTGAAYGLVIGTVTYHVADNMGPVQRTLTSASLGLVPGLAWEIKDAFEKDNHFGWDDLLADGIGAITGAVAAELINGQLWVSASGKQIRLIGKW